MKLSYCRDSARRSEVAVISGISVSITIGHITSKSRIILYRSTLLNTNAESIGVAPVNLTLFTVI